MSSFQRVLPEFLIFLLLLRFYPQHGNYQYKFLVNSNSVNSSVRKSALSKFSNKTMKNQLTSPQNWFQEAILEIWLLAQKKKKNAEEFCLGKSIGFQCAKEVDGGRFLFFLAKDFRKPVCRIRVFRLTRVINHYTTADPQLGTTVQAYSACFPLHGVSLSKMYKRFLHEFGFLVH